MSMMRFVIVLLNEYMNEYEWIDECVERSVTHFQLFLPRVIEKEYVGCRRYRK